MELKIIFSKEHEVNRIKDTFKKYKWGKENGYRINLPDVIRSKVETNENITDEEILNVVSNEYEEKRYKEKADQLQSNWNKIENKFVRALNTLGGEVQKEYKVYLTKYGFGGSYHWPNEVYINFDYGSNYKWIWIIVVHEIIHLVIHKWIKEYEIEHWTKERIVDLIIRKIFPEINKLQRSPKNAEKIEKIFNQNFPDIKTIIQKSSNTKN